MSYLRFSPRRRSLRPGQALVEFALVVIPLIVLTMAMVDFARLWMQYQTVTNSAREAARMAVIADDESEDPAAKEVAIYNSIKNSLATVGIETTGAQFFGGCQEMGSGTPAAPEIYACGWEGTRGTPATVGIRIPYEFPFLGAFLGWAPNGGQVALSTSFVMRNE